MIVRNTCLLAVLCLALCSGCASMAHGTKETIEAASDPAGADVTVTCSGHTIASGVTPAHFTMPRKLEDCEARFSKEGFDEARIAMQRGMSRNYWGDLGLSAGIPAGIAVAVGSGLFTNKNEGTVNALVTVGLAGAAGLIIDRVDGAMYDHPATLHARLRPRVPSAAASGSR